jgi:hypothetical protein
VSRNLARAIEFRVSYVGAIFVQFFTYHGEIYKCKLVRHSILALPVYVKKKLLVASHPYCDDDNNDAIVPGRDNKEVTICLNLSTKKKKSTMKFSIAIFLASTASSTFANAFTPTTSAAGRTTGTSSALNTGGMSSDVGIPCTEECALASFPNLPDSIHPGVLSGQAMMDLLQHAKDNGKKKIYSFVS